MRMRALARLAANRRRRLDVNGRPGFDLAREEAESSARSASRLAASWDGGPPVAPDLAGATEAYQALLEGHRRDPDDELLFEDLAKAADALQVAWVMAGGGAR